MRAQWSLLFVSLALNGYLAVELMQAQNAASEARELVRTASKHLVLGCLPVYVGNPLKEPDITHL